MIKINAIEGILCQGAGFLLIFPQAIPGKEIAPMYTPLPANPDLDRLKLLARELRDAFTAGDAEAGLRVGRHRGPTAPESTDFSLRIAQLVIAREHGFTSWDRLGQYLDSPARPAASDDERVPGQPHSRERLRRLSREEYPINAGQVQNILDNYRLGVLSTFRTVGGTNFPNTVIAVRATSGDGFILKIQTRAMPDWSLRQEHGAICALQGVDEVPVSEKCELDESRKILPFPYLVSNRLEGRQGELFFQQAPHELRLTLAEKLGDVTARIHERTPPPGLPALPLDMRGVEEALLGNVVLKQELEAQVPGFERRLRRAMGDLQYTGETGDEVMLKVEAGLHNLLVKQNGRSVRISGLFDFQAARRGPRITDLTKVEGSLATHAARGPSCPSRHQGRCVEAMRQAYRGRCGFNPEFDDETHLMLDVIGHARLVRYWWDCLEYLHPRNPLWIERVLLGLMRLGGS